MRSWPSTPSTSDSCSRSRNRRLGSLSDAEDATAEVFRLALIHYRTTGELRLRWVYRTLHHVIGNEYRRRSRQPDSLDAHLLAGWDLADASHPDDAIAARQALTGLGDTDRELIFMAYWEDLTPAEIAAALGCAEVTARVRLHRARHRLRERLLDQSSEQGSTKRNG